MTGRDIYRCNKAELREYVVVLTRDAAEEKAARLAAEAAQASLANDLSKLLERSRKLVAAVNKMDNAERELTKAQDWSQMARHGLFAALETLESLTRVQMTFEQRDGKWQRNED